MKNTFNASLSKVAKEVGKLEYQVSKAEYTSSEHALPEWDLRKRGGFQALKELGFPEEKDVQFQSSAKQIRQHRNKLNEEYGAKLALKEELLEAVKENFKQNPLQLHKPLKAQKKTKTNRSLVLHISDTHFGCNIEKDEMGGLNEFNWEVAARRMAFLVLQATTYKPQHQQSTELVVCLNGDIMAGIIHDQEWGVDLLAKQFGGTFSILSQALSFLASKFKSVKVECTTGNHSRMMHKANKSRASSKKFDSFESILYSGLRDIVCGKHSNISFNIPTTPYSIFEVQGHKFLQTHGDTVINVGNPGNNLNMKSINDQINKANSHLIPGEQNFAALLVGHVHVPTIQLTDSGTMLLINGTLSGLDPFAQSLGIFSNHPTQTIFEVVPDHAVGDIRIIRLKQADSDKSLDKIIKPFTAQF